MRSSLTVCAGANLFDARAPMGWTDRIPGIRLRGRQLRTAFQTWMHRVSLASPPPGSHPHAMRGGPCFSLRRSIPRQARGPAPPYGVAVLRLDAQRLTFPSLALRYSVSFELRHPPSGSHPHARGPCSALRRRSSLTRCAGDNLFGLGTIPRLIGNPLNFKLLAPCRHCAHLFALQCKKSHNLLIYRSLDHPATGAG